MIRKLSLQLVMYWKNAGEILDDAGSIEIYCYGLELFFSSILNLLFLIIISVIFGIPFAFIPYLLGFIPIRVMAGGYHANAHWSCITVFSTAYILVLLMMQYHGNSMTQEFCVVISVISVLVIWCLSPLPAKNKPLSQLETMAYRKISLALCVLFFFVAVYQAVFFSNITRPIKLFFCGEGIAVLSLIVAKLISKQREIWVPR